MKILAFDGTARAASVAICEDDMPLGIYTIDNGLTQSELLLPMAEEMLSSLKLTFSDIELFATSVGPGSFTGVRIGTALVKGLAFGRDIPCASVSTLEALAENTAPLAGVHVPCMDARRSQVYTAIFKSDGERLTRLSKDMAISIEALAKILSECDGERIYISGDGYDVARKGLISYGITPEITPVLLRNENAASVARVAFRNFKEGICTTDRELSPTYLRLPQAERERLEREKSKS